jgi:hypothetical protein
VDQRHTQLDWQRSSRCSNGSCVEAARTTDAFLVRDSKETGGPILRFGRSEWTAFISAVKAGEIRGTDHRDGTGGTAHCDPSVPSPASLDNQPVSVNA